MKKAAGHSETISGTVQVQSGLVNYTGTVTTVTPVVATVAAERQIQSGEVLATAVPPSSGNLRF